MVGLCLALFSNSIAITNLFPYSPFMVKFFLPGLDERNVGYYAGFIATSGATGAMLTSFYLGRLADRRGRKFVIMLGLVSCIVPQLAFGLAPGLAFACAMRFIGGMTNGIVAAAKAAAPELVPAHQQAWAMSVISG